MMTTIKIFQMRLIHFLEFKLMVVLKIVQKQLIPKTLLKMMTMKKKKMKYKKISSRSLQENFFMKTQEYPLSLIAFHLRVQLYKSLCLKTFNASTYASNHDNA